ncbi:MAG: AraC family transcriptional regulator [Planctomycetota bacterium]|jgi:AraC family cel operon transcriptional repressor|nr:AraC family transcriptional regulator [Planctomycetota bacterium]
MDLIRWAHLAPRADGCHVARSHYRPGSVLAMHDHDFAELSWIERGSLIHETPRQRRELTAGAALLVRPGHCHGLRGGSGGGRLVNIAISTTMLGELESRYAGDPAWPWASSDDITLFQLGPADLAAISSGFERFARTGDQPLLRDAFICDCLARLRGDDSDELWHGAPPWLAQACAACTRPPRLADGPAALAQLTGRSREHIARSLRQHCGLSPRELFVELRLRYATERLALGNEDITTIAQHCGTGNRSHFTTSFKHRYGCTPGAYRRRSRLASG